MRLDAVLQSLMTEVAYAASSTTGDHARDVHVDKMIQFSNYCHAKARGTLTPQEVARVIPGYQRVISNFPNPIQLLAARTALRAQARVGLEITDKPEPARDLTFAETKTVFRRRGLMLAYLDAVRERNNRLAIDWQNPPATITIVGRNRGGDAHTVHHPDCLTPEEASTLTKKPVHYYITVAWNPDTQEYHIQKIDGSHSFPLALSYVLGRRGWRIQNEVESAILSETWGARKYREMGPVTRPKLNAYLASGGVALEYLWDLKRVANPLLEARPQKLYLIGTFKKPTNKNSLVTGLQLVTAEELETERKKIGFVVPFVLQNNTYRLDKDDPRPFYHGDELAESLATGEANFSGYYDLARVGFAQIKKVVSDPRLIDPFFRVVRHRKSQAGAQGRIEGMPQFNLASPPTHTLAFHKQHASDTLPVSGLRVLSEQELRENPGKISNRLSTLTFGYYHGRRYLRAITGKGSLELGLAFFMGQHGMESLDIIEKSILANQWGDGKTDGKSEETSISWKSVLDYFSQDGKDVIAQLWQRKRQANPRLKKHPETVVLITRKVFREGRFPLATRPSLMTEDQARRLGEYDKSANAVVTFKWFEGKYHVVHAQGAGAFELVSAYLRYGHKIFLQNVVERAIVANHLGNQLVKGEYYLPLIWQELLRELRRSKKLVTQLWALKRSVDPGLLEKPPKLFLVGNRNDKHSARCLVVGLRLVTEKELRAGPLAFVVPFIRNGDDYVPEPPSLPLHTGSHELYKAAMTPVTEIDLLQPDQRRHVQRLITNLMSGNSPDPMDTINGLPSQEEKRALITEVATWLLTGEQDIAEDCLDILEIWLDELLSPERSACLEILSQHFAQHPLNEGLANEREYFWLRAIHGFVRRVQREYRNRKGLPKT